MPTPTRDPRRNLPSIATGAMVVWLAAVCAYSTLAAPVSAPRPGAQGAVRTVLGETVSRRPPATSQAAMTSFEEPSTRSRVSPPAPKEKPKRTTKQRKKKRKKEPRIAPGHALPLPLRIVEPEELRDRHHDYPALDIAVKPGTKVLAVTPGRVKDTTGRGSCGKGVILRGKDGFTYTYCHGNKRFVGPGKWVDAGEPIMASGNTGNSTGPHLHLQITRPNGKLVCPQHLLPAWQKGVRKSPWKAQSKGCHSGRYRHRNPRKWARKN